MRYACIIIIFILRVLFGFSAIMNYNKLYMSRITSASQHIMILQYTSILYIGHNQDCDFKALKYHEICMH